MRNAAAGERRGGQVLRWESVVLESVAARLAKKSRSWYRRGMDSRVKG